MRKTFVCLSLVAAVVLGTVAAKEENTYKASATEKEAVCTDLPAAGAALSDLAYRKTDAAQIRCMNLSEIDMQILLQIAAAEAGTEDAKGKALVMRVVLNRMADSEFPDTVPEVVFQSRKGVYQFSPVKNGAYQSAEITPDCYEALGMVLSGWDESKEATYFCTPEAAGKWHEDHLFFIFQHGGLRFYK